MRKLSCEWPIGLTVFAFIFPFFYVLDRKEFVEEVRCAVACTIIIWFIYGVACLFARPLRDISKKKPWRPSKDFHTQTHKGDDSKVSCKGCGEPLPQAQIDFGLGNPKYNEWCREGFCSFTCFDNY